MNRCNICLASRLVVLAAVLACVTTDVRADPVYCENLAGDWVMVGEAQFATRSSTDTCYANAFSYNYLTGQSTDKLNTMYLPVGAAATDTNSLNWVVFAAHQDNTTSDCTDAVFTFDIQYANTESTNRCPNGGSTATSYMYMASCNTIGTCSGNTCALYGGKLFGFYNRSFYTFWRADIETTGGTTGCTDDDFGCWPLWRPTDCTLVNF